MPRKKRLPTGSPLALDRLLDAYVHTEECDPGMDDLRSVRNKLPLFSQDHTVYVRAFGGGS